MPFDQSASLTLPSDEIARTLRVGVATINRWAKTGTMPAYRVGRSWIVVRSQFEAWMASTTDASVEMPPLTEALSALPPILRVDEVADLLHVSDATVRLLIEEQSLGAYDLGTLHRVPREALTRWLSESSNVPQ